jgi:hypothetical protein
MGCFYLCLLLLGASNGHAQTVPTSEYQLKAVFLFNFAQFVEWPPQAFADAETPLVIGVLGEDPFGSYLDETVRGEAMKGHPMVVRRYREVEEVEACHILFISQTRAGRMEQILTRLNGQNVLTVSDAPGFARQGGMIEFVTNRNKIRLRMNLEAARVADLTISSKLLRLADLVAPREG